MTKIKYSSWTRRQSIVGSSIAEWIGATSSILLKNIMHRPVRKPLFYDHVCNALTTSPLAFPHNMKHIAVQKLYSYLHVSYFVSDGHVSSPWSSLRNTTSISWPACATYICKSNGTDWSMPRKRNKIAIIGKCCRNRMFKVNAKSHILRGKEE